MVRFSGGAGQEVAQDHISFTTVLIIIAMYPKAYSFSFYFTLFIIQCISTLDH